MPTHVPVSLSVRALSWLRRSTRVASYESLSSVLSCFAVFETQQEGQDDRQAGTGCARPRQQRGLQSTCLDVLHSLRHKLEADTDPRRGARERTRKLPTNQPTFGLCLLCLLEPGHLALQLLQLSSSSLVGALGGVTLGLCGYTSESERGSMCDGASSLGMAWYGSIGQHRVAR